MTGTDLNSNIPDQPEMWDRCKFWKFDTDKDGKVLFEEWKSFGLNNKPWFWLHIYKY